MISGMIKTAISLSDLIYREMDSLARQLRVPRSRLFALAAEEFLQRHRKKELIKKINATVNERNKNEDDKYLLAIKRGIGNWLKNNSDSSR